MFGVLKVQEAEFPFSHWLNLSILNHVAAYLRFLGLICLWGLFKETEETEFLGMDFVAEVARISRDFYKKIVRPN